MKKKEGREKKRKKEKVVVFIYFLFFIFLSKAYIMYNKWCLFAFFLLCSFIESSECIAV